MKIKKRLQESVIELVDVGESNVCGHSKERVVNACNEVCVEMRRRRRKENTWWWNKEVNKAISRKKMEGLHGKGRE